MLLGCVLGISVVLSSRSSVRIDTVSLEFVIGKEIIARSAVNLLVDALLAFCLVPLALLQMQTLVQQQQVELKLIAKAGATLVVSDDEITVRAHQRLTMRLLP